MIEHLGFRIDAERGVIYGRRGKPIGAKTRNGYLLVTWWADGKCKGANSHRVIWEAVHGPIPAGMEINHMNGIKTDNRISNLEMVSASQNQLHAFRTGLQKCKLNEEKVREIRALRTGGALLREIASQYGIHETTVVNVCSGHRWKEVA